MIKIYSVKGKKFSINDFGCYNVEMEKARPTVRHNGKVMSAARFIYEQCFGEIPEGLLVRHKCDNAFCINPEHLELGTHKQNMNDLYLKRRLKNRTHRHLLSNNEMLKAKHLIEDKGFSMAEAAIEMNFPYSSLYCSLNNPKLKLKIPEETIKIAKLLKSKGEPLKNISNKMEIPFKFLEEKIEEPEKPKDRMKDNDIQKAIELFRNGMTYPDIADRLEYPLSTVFHTIKEFL